MKNQLQPRLVTEKEWVYTILGLAILFGVFVRVFPALLSDFPINDGGMFAVMMRDLQANNFLLPTFTTYNLANIPFAYPPLAFYIGALLQIFGISETQILIWLPAFLSSLTIPLFYLLVFQLTKSRIHASLAAMFFALTPGNYVWLLMGGGLTRALGTCFLILAIYFVHRAYQESNIKITTFAIIFCSLTVLSHPQMALIATVSSFIFLLFAVRMKKSILHATIIAFGTLLFTSIWWVNIISQHGFDVFISAGQSGNLRASLTALIENLFSIQTFLPFATIFRILGLTWLIYKKRFDLLIWGFSLYLIDQRSAPILTSFLFPILSAFGFADVLPAFINWFRNKKFTPLPYEKLFNHHASSMTLLGITFYLFIECGFHAFVIRNLTLPNEAREVMIWIKENTTPENSFLILTGREDVMTDPVQEWFPALAERHSETTLQGLEWTLQNEFENRWNQLAELQQCEDLICVNNQAQAMNLEFTYLMLDKSNFDVEKFILNISNVIFENDRYMVVSQ